ncbi:hypothetical protein PSTT_16276 [Puccinia striiformis]|uniref:Uncharacterized protein n=1 Tax=Puccinia striiformis TaxID=27350 RepID=A0A2S4UE14_9BASI|nr:hypothetical protein PSTT_16276 [Puccinia striiformis]
MGNVRFVIPTFDLKPWLGFATSVILVLMGEDVSSVVALVLVMLTIGEGTSWQTYLLGIGTECTRLEKDRDGCPKIVNLGLSCIPNSNKIVSICVLVGQICFTRENDW